ncbi:hypothetical protein OTH22_17235, partial [Bacteroides fragilis]|uniref:hypothetical protein n=1 Tax=Bacteroides hominis TaxID=2763023 RepID=UPI002940114E|nr:hypothetical protein [Bacteroides fragilis]
GSKFTCTTCIVYQFFKELFFSIALRFKSGCKGKRFILKHQMFSEVFFQCPPFISKPLCAKGKEVSDKDPHSANRTAKITTFIIMIQIKRKLFLLSVKADPTPLQHVKI